MSKTVLVTMLSALLMIGFTGVSNAQTPTVNQEDTNECAVIIGIDDSGLAFDQIDVQINAGDTVCWIWNNESMAHNVAQTSSENTDSRKSGGVYSGEASTTVDFRHTFDTNQTFHYICEPHVSVDMRGKIVVGDGADDTAPDASNNPEKTVPGFGIVSVVFAAFIALVYLRVETLRMIAPKGSRIPRQI
jgi:plastocyanin